jgi:hypothetical protein
MKLVRTIEHISNRILTIRRQRVMIDSDLAALYGVATRQLNQQVKRNPRRFPARFAFRLTPAERAEVVTNCDHLQALKYSAVLPLAFTEHGALMAASILNSSRAIKVGIYVVTAFVEMRDTLRTNKALDKRIDELESRVGTHDHAIREILAAIRQLTARPEPAKRRRIGFVQD